MIPILLWKKTLQSSFVITLQCIAWKFTIKTFLITLSFLCCNLRKRSFVLYLDSEIWSLIKTEVSPNLTADIWLFVRELMITPKSFLWWKPSTLEQCLFLSLVWLHFLERQDQVMKRFLPLEAKAFKIMSAFKQYHCCKAAFVVNHAFFIQIIYRFSTNTLH